MRLKVFPTILTLLLGAAPAPARSNDGAAEVAAGGIQLRNERRIAMRKERLFIGLDKVRVEYEFVNESKDDVTTEVAFPIPELSYSYFGNWRASFEDFRAWVGEAEIPVTTEVRAFVGKREVTSRLRLLGIALESFGGARQVGDDPVERSADLERQPAATLRALREDGIIVKTAEGEPDFPAWRVRITKHWTQRFPAGQVVRIRHEYRPQAGEQNSGGFLDESCADPAFRKAANAEVGRVVPQWVSYVLTTANTWKTPIQDFELIVEHAEGTAASFCWDGKVERVGPRTLRATRRDFLPTKELTVYFFRSYR